MPLATVCVSSCRSSLSLSLSGMAWEQLNTQGQVVKKWIKLPRLNYALSCPQNSVQLIITSNALWRIKVDFLETIFERFLNKLALKCAPDWSYRNTGTLLVKGVLLSWRHLLTGHVRWNSPSNKTATYLNIYWQWRKGGKGRGLGLNAAMAVSCQNSFRAPAAKLVYKLMH